MTKAGIIELFQSETTAFTQLSNSFSDAQFSTQPHAEKWSAAQNLKHLVQVHAAIAGGIKDPSKLPQFGDSDTKPTRSYEAIRDFYLTGLAKATAAGRFPYKHLDTPETRTELLASFASLNEKITGRIAALTEDELDNLQLPHPVLGLMKIREMLMFITYHVRHHIDIVSRIVVEK
jgi:uncharacterized damage-inducible protein DinB